MYCTSGTDTVFQIKQIRVPVFSHVFEFELQLYSFCIRMNYVVCVCVCNCVCVCVRICICILYFVLSTCRYLYLCVKFMWYMLVVSQLYRSPYSEASLWVVLSLGLYCPTMLSFLCMSLYPPLDFTNTNLHQLTQLFLKKLNTLHSLKNGYGPIAHICFTFSF